MPMTGTKVELKKIENVNPTTTVSSFTQMVSTTTGIKKSDLNLSIGEVGLTSSRKQVKSYGIVPDALVVIKIRGQGGAKTTTAKDNSAKDFKHRAKMTMLKEVLDDKIASVNKSSKELPVIAQLEASMRSFAVKVESNASEAMAEQAYSLDISTLKEISSILSSSGAGTAEGKLKQCAGLLFGSTMEAAKNIQTSLNAVIESGPMVVNYAFSKAVTENPKYSMASFKMMIEAILNQKIGEQKGQSSDGMDGVIGGLSRSSLG